MPIIVEEVPLACKEIVAGNIMSKDVLTFDCVESMENIEDALLNTNHHMFPVVNNKGLVIGTIPRNFIIVLIKYECFYNPNGKSIVESLKESKGNLKAKQNHMEKDKSSFTRQQSFAR